MFPSWLFRRFLHVVISHCNNLINNIYIKIDFSSLSWKDKTESDSVASCSIPLLSWGKMKICGNLLRTQVLYTSACVNGGFGAQLAGGSF